MAGVKGKSGRKDHSIGSKAGRKKYTDPCKVLILRKTFRLRDESPEELKKTVEFLTKQRDLFYQEKDKNI